MNGFCCPGCRQPLKYNGDADAGYLLCDDCGTAFPYVQGMAFFDKPTLAPLTDQPLFPALCQQLFGNEASYAHFIQTKHQRPNHDAYAAFQPFNESTRALYCLFDEIKLHVKPGQPILDLWGRTAWSGESLAAYFPDNPIYMIWEGDRNVLGYKGYHYWLKQGRRAPNLHIVFTDLEKPLPFPDGFFGLVHGLDTFHRYGPVPLLAECFRVSLPSAPIVFPHIHLTNNEPDPYFERGCTQYHGTVYRQWMDRIRQAHGREAYLLSEKALFERSEAGHMVDDHNMEHYNALLYIAPEGVHTSYLTPCHWPEVPVGEATQVVLNPLLRVDAVTGVVDVDMSLMGGLSAHLLERHPLYHDRLRQWFPLVLDDCDRKLLFCLEQGMDILQVGRLLGVSTEELGRQLHSLQEREICTYANVSQAMAALQHFYGTQQWVHPLQHQADFRVLWQYAEAEAGGEPLFISTAQDVEYEWPDVQQLVLSIHLRFVQMGLQPGDKVVLCASQHPAYLLTIWAAWLSGLVAVPVCPQSQQANFGYIIDLIQPAVVFVEPGVDLRSHFAGDLVVFDALDDVEQEGADVSFSEWLDTPSDEISPEYRHFETAAILFSSGTTGQPKAIAHSFASLLSGSLKLSGFYQLPTASRLLSVGGYHSMSGLRNAAVLPLVNSQTLLLADAPRENMLTQFLTISGHYQPDIVFSTPALVNTLNKLKTKLEKHQYSSIKTWLCTGASVSCAMLAELSDELGIRFENYYGLTETGGFCAGTLLESVHQTSSIGRPVGAIFRVVDQRGESVKSGEEGFLEVFSDQLMQGYLSTDGLCGSDESGKSTAPFHDGWLATGDKVYALSSGEIILLGRGDDEFSTSAGELVNLGYLELSLQDRVQAEFALLHANGQLIVVLECEAGQCEEHQQSKPVVELLTLLRNRQYGAISDLVITSIPLIPRTSNGKIQRSVLKHLLQQQ